jgi:hypothetical protein
MRPGVSFANPTSFTQELLNEALKSLPLMGSKRVLIDEQVFGYEWIAANGSHGFNPPGWFEIVFMYPVSKSTQ